MKFKLTETQGELHIYEMVEPHDWPWVFLWHTTDDDKVRCVSCQGERVAMSGSCRHAKALKRFLKVKK